MKAAEQVLWQIPTFYEEFAKEQSLEKSRRVKFRISPSLNAIGQRQDKSLRYKNEHPRYNDEMSRGLEIADTIYHRNLPLSSPELRELLATYGTSDAPARSGSCYIAMEKDNYEKCKPGFTVDEMRRLPDIQTSKVVVYHAVFLFKHSVQAYRVEQAVLRYFEDKKLRGEWREVPPSAAAEMVQKIAVEMGYSFEVIPLREAA